MKRLLFVLLTLSFSQLFAAKATQGFNFSQGLGASYNPLGVALDTTFFYRLPLSDSSEMLWESMKIDFGIKNSLTPADDRLSVFINIEPIAVFDVTLHVGYTGMYKLLGYGFVDVPNGRSSLSEASIAGIPQQDKGGLFIKASPEFKVQFGPVILVDALDFLYINVGSEDKYYNDRKEAIVMKYADSLMINNVYALYDFSNGLYAGLNYYILWNTVTAWGTQYLAALGAYDWKLDMQSSVSFNLLVGWYFYDGYTQYNTGFPYLAFQATYNLKL